MDNLYHDVFTYILSFLSQKDLIRLMRVSKRFYNTINNLKLPSFDFYTSCLKGYYLNIRKWLQLKKSFDLNMAFLNACIGGNLDIVMLMIKNGANNWNLGLYAACKGGKKQIIDLMIKNGATDFYWALEGATENGADELIDLMLQKSINTYVCSFI
ncbi:MAG: F-box protein [Candidatus Micrarchaeaceae archaeon]